MKDKEKMQEDKIMQELADEGERAQVVIKSAFMEHRVGLAPGAMALAVLLVQSCESMGMTPESMLDNVRDLMETAAPFIN